MVWKDFAYFGTRDTATLSKEVYREIWDMTNGTVAVDIETVGLLNREPLGIAFAPNPQDAFYFHIDSDYLPWHVLENPAITKLFHNGAFDLGVMMEFFDMEIEPVIDSMAAAQLQGLPISLEALSLQLFNIQLTTIESLIGPKGKGQLTMDQIDPDKVAAKGGQDVLYTYRVWEAIKQNVQWPVFLLETEYAPVLNRMKNLGLRVDRRRLQEHKETIGKEVAYYRSLAQGLGFNPGSSKQLAVMLESHGWNIKRNRTTNNPILNEQELSTTYKDDPLAALALNYRQKKVLLSTFIEALEKKHLDGDRIYPDLNQFIVRSGRVSRSKPNTQNIPPNMRDIFIPSEGNIYESWDLSQIELRILAYLVWLFTGDYTMQGVFDGGGDIHKATMGFMANYGITIDRKNSKTVNFGVVYRGTEWTLYQRSGIPLQTGKLFLYTLNQIYPGIEIFFQQTRKELYQDGFVSTMLGRRRYFPDLEEALNDPELGWLVAKFEREAFNHKIQGTAGEDLKRLQIRNADIPQCNTIHDQVVFDIHPTMELNRESSIALATYRTPMDVSRGDSWWACDQDENKILNPNHPTGVWG